jgi:electron transfer flavoprotein alpha subunit
MSVSGDIVIIVFGAAGYDRAAAGLAGAGRRLADERQVRLQAIVAGSASDELVRGLSRVADRVLIADQPELQAYQPETTLTALVAICKEIGPRAILLGNDTYSQELAPRLAHRLGGSACGDGIEIHLGSESARVTRQVYGGKAQAVIELKRMPAVAWLRARAFPVTAPRDTAGEVSHSTTKVQADNRTRIVERSGTTSTEMRLEDARVIVSGGRGIGGPEGFATELQPLAELLGAQMGASRAACDAGWVPPTWQIGQTGKKVAPDLYLAIAITGASQHMAGISEAKNIAVINIDPDAPIFRHARFGIVEDYRKVVPLLREKLKALQK